MAAPLRVRFKKTASWYLRSKESQFRAELCQGDKVIRIGARECGVLLFFAGPRPRSLFELSEVFWPNPDIMPDRWEDQLRVSLSHFNRAKLVPLGWKIQRSGCGSGLYALKPLEEKKDA